MWPPFCKIMPFIYWDWKSVSKLIRGSYFRLVFEYKFCFHSFRPGKGPAGQTVPAFSTSQLPNLLNKYRGFWPFTCLSNDTVSYWLHFGSLLPLSGKNTGSQSFNYDWKSIKCCEINSASLFISYFFYLGQRFALRVRISVFLICLPNEYYNYERWYTIHLHQAYLFIPL